jgi:hypothetical protein
MDKYDPVINMRIRISCCCNLSHNIPAASHLWRLLLLHTELYGKYPIVLTSVVTLSRSNLSLVSFDKVESLPITLTEVLPSHLLPHSVSQFLFRHFFCICVWM